MKRLYIAGLFLAVCIGLCVYEQIVINDLYDTCVACIDEAIEYTDNNEYERAGEVCKTLSEYWKKRYSVVTSMAEHDVVDDAGVIILSLADKAANDPEALRGELVNAKIQLRLIKDGAKVSFGNIF